MNRSASQILGEVEEIGVLLTLTEEFLTLASVSLRDTSDLLLETGELIEESDSLLRSVGDVVGEKAPQTIESTQQDAFGSNTIWLSGCGFDVKGTLCFRAHHRLFL